MGKRKEEEEKKEEGKENRKLSMGRVFLLS